MAPQSKWPPNRIFEWREKHHRDFHISPLPHFPHVVHMHTHMHMHTEMHTTATCYSYSCYLWRTQLNKGSWDLSHFLIAKFPHCAVASLSMDMDVHLDAAKDCKSAAGSASIRRIKWISWMRVGVAKAYVRGEIVLPMWLRTPRRSLHAACCFLFVVADFPIWFFIMQTQWQLSRGPGKLARETVAGCTLHGGQPSDWLMVWEINALEHNNI